MNLCWCNYPLAPKELCFVHCILIRDFIEIRLRFEPALVKATVEHKSGWLERWSISSNRTPPTFSTVLENALGAPSFVEGTFRLQWKVKDPIGSDHNLHCLRFKVPINFCTWKGPNLTTSWLSWCIILEMMKWSEVQSPSRTYNRLLTCPTSFWPSHRVIDAGQDRGVECLFTRMNIGGRIPSLPMTLTFYNCMKLIPQYRMTLALRQM